MGLAAGQARFLTITGRKSDCEFESMRLSHQKIALARELADLSNEYENSLNQTKLIYDYYGTGESSSPLSYGILMTPSVLNDYMPTTITDTAGRVVLNSKYAAAARVAGIPQEGIGTLPSDMMRNTFVNAMADNGIITENMRKTIQGLPYNQQAGFGGGAVVMAETQEITYNQLLQKIKEQSASYTIDNKTLPGKDRGNAKGDGEYNCVDFAVLDENGNWTKSWDHNISIVETFTLYDLLNGNKQFYLDYEGIKGELSPYYGVPMMQKWLTQENGIIDWLKESFAEVLDFGDPIAQEALDYATNELKNLIMPNEADTDHVNSVNEGKDTDEKTQWKKEWVSGFLSTVGTVTSSSVGKSYNAEVVQGSKDYVGFVYAASNKNSKDDGKRRSTAGININNLSKAFLTYFYDFMNGISKVDSNGIDKYNVSIGNNSKLVTEDTTAKFIVQTGLSVSSDDLAQSQFYDALFNQICQNGWTENDNVTNNEYLQETLQKGMLFVSRMKDDGYYYQSNYSTDTYIKEVADETLIAQAEARYQTEKAKLNAKEQVLDLKMKNLDTEITSLTTEYESVKNTITKNVEKAFKRYSA